MGLWRKRIILSIPKCQVSFKNITFNTAAKFCSNPRFYMIDCGFLDWDFLTKVKLPELGQSKPAEIRPVKGLSKNYETMKSYKITGKPNNIWISFIKAGSLIPAFVQKIPVNAGVKLIFIMKTELQKEHFFGKISPFSATDASVLKRY